jgi:hypothetical protein
MFALSESQQRKIDKWILEVINPKLLEKARNGEPGYWIIEDEGTAYAYAGAIGGEYTYKFTPTSLGVIIQVEHFIGEKIDVTDYELW